MTASDFATPVQAKGYHLSSTTVAPQGSHVAHQRGEEPYLRGDPSRSLFRLTSSANFTYAVTLIHQRPEFHM
jgi:hypothetical protein